MKTEQQRLSALHTLVSEEIGGDPTSNLNVVPAALASIYSAGQCSRDDVYRYIQLAAEMATVIYANLSAEYMHVRLAILLGCSMERIDPKVAINFLFGGGQGYRPEDITASFEAETQRVAAPNRIDAE